MLIFPKMLICPMSKMFCFHLPLILNAVDKFMPAAAVMMGSM